MHISLIFQRYRIVNRYGDGDKGSSIAAQVTTGHFIEPPALPANNMIAAMKNKLKSVLRQEICLLK